MSSAPAPTSPFNQAVIDASRQVQEDVRRDLLDRVGTEQAVVAAAPAGAGKSHFVVETVADLRDRDLRVAVVAPTNEQVHSLVDTITRLYPGLPVAFVPAAGRELPASIAARPGVSQPKARDARDHRDPLVAATVHKLADAHLRDGLGDFDVLVMDEGYQADAARYYTAAATASTHLLVGDSGQLDPFSTYDDPTIWRGGAEDPLQTAVGVLLRNHPTTPVHQLPITRRLDPRAVPVARAFYPGHPFESAVLGGVRELRLDRPGPGTGVYAVIDRALDEATTSGWAYVTLPGAPVIRADATTAQTIIELAFRLLARNASAMCENRAGREPLQPSNIAIAVAHNDQKDIVRVFLDRTGLSGVTVDTANRLQGLTFEVVIVWHPLAGSTDTDAFHLDPGRLCVMLTRHRQACIVVGRDTDRELLDGIPPATPGFLGWDPDPVLDGWDAHETVFRLLEPHVVIA